MSRRTPINVTGGIYNSSSPVFTDGQFVAFQFDANGNLLTTGGGSGSNASVNPVGTPVPSSATMIGWDDGSGNTQFVSAANPLPISGSITATNPSVGATGSAVPASATYIGVSDGSGNLVGASAAHPVRIDPTGSTVQPVSGTFWQATQPVSGTVTANQGTAAALTAGWPTVDGLLAPSTATWTSSTTTNTAITLSNTQGYATALLTLNQTGSMLAFTVVGEGFDGTNWVPIYTNTDDSGILTATILLSSSTTQHFYHFNVVGFQQFRIRVTQVTIAGGQAVFALSAQATPVPNLVSVTGISGTITVTGAVTASQSGNWTTRIVGAAGVTLDAVLGATKPANVLQVGGNDGTNAYAIPLVSGGASVAVSLIAGTAVIGHVITDSGSTTAVTQATASSLNATVVGTGTFAVQAAQSGTFTVGLSAAQTLATLTTITNAVKVTGNAGGAFDAVADGATAPPANAIQVGMIAATALPAAYTATKIVPPMTDKFGRQVVVVNTVRDLIGTFSVQTTGTGSNTLIAAGGSGVFTDITNLVITIATATATEISLSDGTTTYKINIAATIGAGLVWALNGSLPATSSNTAWTVTSSASVTLNFSGTYAKNK